MAAITINLAKYGFWKFILAVCTMLGAFGGFPEPPKSFTSLTQYKVVQWALLYVLLYQGGAGEDPVFAGVITGITFLIYTLLRSLEERGVNTDVADLVQA